MSLPSARSQEDRILWQLQAAFPEWTPAPVLSRISLQYNARIFSLRRKNLGASSTRSHWLRNSIVGASGCYGMNPVGSRSDERRGAVVTPQFLSKRNLVQEASSKS
jgi:hypothetical protein